MPPPLFDNGFEISSTARGRSTHSASITLLCRLRSIALVYADSLLGDDLPVRDLVYKVDRSAVIRAPLKGFFVDPQAVVPRAAKSRISDGCTLIIRSGQRETKSGLKMLIYPASTISSILCSSRCALILSSSAAREPHSSRLHTTAGCRVLAPSQARTRRRGSIRVDLSPETIGGLRMRQTAHTGLSLPGNKYSNSCLYRKITSGTVQQRITPDQTRPLRQEYRLPLRQIAGSRARSPPAPRRPRASCRPPY